MYRNALKYLKNWIKRDKSKPLLLCGARQVGKTELIRIFAKKYNFDLLEINLEIEKLHHLSEIETFKIEKVLEEIELVANKKITKNTIIFLDEIQACPIAINRLRYFYEKTPHLKIIAAGSLLEVVLDKESFSMPVGRVEYMYLGPMSFFEFLRAANQTILLEQLTNIKSNGIISKSLHDKSIEMLKIYYYIGGMPESVSEYAHTKDMLRVKQIQKTILKTFRDDIPKYAKNKKEIRVNEVFDYAHANIGKKVIWAEISKDHSSRVKDAVTLLDLAHVINKVIHSKVLGIPIKSSENQNIVKLYCLDVGLYNASLGIEWSNIFHLNNKDLVTSGMMAEQFIAQHLLIQNQDSLETNLNYWLNKEKKNAAEVDFVIQFHNKIYPIEVKAGSTGKMKSAWEFIKTKKLDHIIKFDLCLREKMISEVKMMNKECILIALPLYLVEKLPDFL